MPTLESLCRRVFVDPGWFVKCLVGALLLVVPVLHFAAFGYFYRMLEQGRRGEPAEFPAWEEWRTLFARGVTFFLIFLVFTVLPLVIGWLLSLPLLPLLGPLARLPLIPALLLAAPLTAASVYRFQHQEEYRDAFNLRVLWLMVTAGRFHLWLPSLAFLGFLVAGFPLLTFTFFVGWAVAATHFGATYRALEESRKAARPRA